MKDSTEKRAYSKGGSDSEVRISIDALSAAHEVNNVKGHAVESCSI